MKNLPANTGDKQVWSLGQEGPLEEGMTTHFSILAWRIPMDGGAWQATVHGFTKSRTQLTYHARIYNMVVQIFLLYSAFNSFGICIFLSF